MRRFFLLVILIISSLSCAPVHTKPKPARPKPLIRVSHNGIIESIDLEEYVAAVLAGEVHASWHPEALKAQAIAARTFALLRMRERKNQPYHVQNSVMDQVYKANPSPSLIDAAKATSGMVLSIRGGLAESSFHSTCGGYTANAQMVWGRSYEHLKGVPCSNCTASKSYSWQEEIPKSEFEQKLGQKIKTIRIKSRSLDGRVEKLELGGEKSRLMSGHDFRMTMGPMRIKSTLIEQILVKDNSVFIRGKGFGHGVGLCQYGALGMAKSGKNFQQILAYYYPGTRLHSMY